MAAGEMKSCCAHLVQALHPVEELILVGRGVFSLHKQETILMA